jgi:hypothetical protein
MKVSVSAAIALALLTVACSSPGWALDVRELAIETQRTERTANTFRMIWWIPREYWEELLNSQPNYPPQACVAFLQAMDPYVIFAVIDGQLSPTGRIMSIPRDHIVSSMKMMVDGLEGRKPLSEREVSSDTTNLLATMKAQFGVALGQAGQALEFVLFDGRDMQQKPLIASRRPGKLTIIYRDKRYSWRLPLGSFLPKRIDPKTGEEFPGNFVFNPFTGSKLTTEGAEPSAPADASKSRR